MDESLPAGRMQTSDSHVWAVISYLDSSTDYREYLPTTSLKCVHAIPTSAFSNQKAESPWKELSSYTLAGSLICVCLLALLQSWS